MEHQGGVASVNTFHRLLQSDAAESRPHLYPRSAQIRGSLEHSVCCSPSMPPNPRNLFISCCTAAHLHCPIKSWHSQQLPVVFPAAASGIPSSCQCSSTTRTICIKQHSHTQHTPSAPIHSKRQYNYTHAPIGPAIQVDTIHSQIIIINPI